MRTWRAIFVLLGMALLLPAGARADERPEQPGTLYILAIGIDQYPPGDRGKLPSLKGCKSDASAIADILEKKAAPRYARVDKQVLFDADATSERVEAAINHIINESKPDDTLVFYFAGHATRGILPGSPRGAANDFLLAMSNANQAGPASAVPGRRLKSWLSQVQASRQLVIFDANSSDIAVQVFRSHVEEDSKEAIALAGRSRLVLGYEGLGMETTDENGTVHGLFTTILLRALSGQADVYPQDGIIRASELEAYVYGAMAEEALKQGVLQHPATWMSGSDFSILIPDAALARATRSPKAGKKKVLSDFMRGFATGAEESNPETPEMPAVKGYALLIGGDHYDHWSTLSNPVFDVTTLGQQLKDFYGFEVEVVKDPTLDDIFNKVREYQKKTFASDDELLIFIAGHGYYDEDGGEGYVIARNSSPPGDELPKSAYSFSNLRTAVDHIKARHILLVLDVCQGGTFDQSVTKDIQHRGGEGEYEGASNSELVETMMKAKTRLYLTSGGKEYVPDGRPGRHSPFTYRVLGALGSRGGKRGILTMDKLRDSVRDLKPLPYSGPFGENEANSDFLFIAAESQSTPAPPKQ